MTKSSPLDRLWRSHLQQSTPPSSLASAAECRATGPPPGRSRIHCNNELSSIQPGCTGCLPGRTGQSALAGWQPWCRCASHSRPSLPWLGTGRNIRGWWLESSVEKGEVAGILPAENTAKHVLCCLLKPVSNSILKLLVPDKWYSCDPVCTNIVAHNCTISSPLHVAASRRMDSSTSSSHIGVPFHQVDHLPMVSRCQQATLTHLDNGLRLEVNVSIEGEQKGVFRSHLYISSANHFRWLTSFWASVNEGLSISWWPRK